MQQRHRSGNDGQACLSWPCSDTVVVMMYCCPAVKLKLLAGTVLAMVLSTRRKGPALNGELGAPTGGMVPWPVCGTQPPALRHQRMCRALKCSVLKRRWSFSTLLPVCPRWACPLHAILHPHAHNSPSCPCAHLRAGGASLRGRRAGVAGAAGGPRGRVAAACGAAPAARGGR